MTARRSASDWGRCRRSAGVVGSAADGVATMTGQRSDSSLAGRAMATPAPVMPVASTPTTALILANLFMVSPCD